MKKYALFASLLLFSWNVPAVERDQQEQRFTTSQGDLVIHPVQHASFVMQWNGKTIYVDPVGNAKLYASYPKADLLFLTHDHPDHLNEEIINAVKGNSIKIIASQSVKEKLNSVNQEHTTLMANGDQKEIEGIPVEAIPMYNTTPERLRYHPKGKGNGYILNLGGKRVYISGDTEDIPEMRALKNIDIAFVCMNLPYTMTVEQAADVVRAFKPKVVYPYHSKGSDLQKFKELVGNDLEIDVRILNWYPE